MEEDSEILQHIEDVIKVVQKKIDTFDRRLDGIEFIQKQLVELKM